MVFQGISLLCFKLFEGVSLLCLMLFQGVSLLCFTLFRGVSLLSFTLFQGVSLLCFMLFQGVSLLCFMTFEGVWMCFNALFILFHDHDTIAVGTSLKYGRHSGWRPAPLGRPKTTQLVLFRLQLKNRNWRFLKKKQVNGYRGFLDAVNSFGISVFSDTFNIVHIWAFYALKKNSLHPTFSHLTFSCAVSFLLPPLLALILFFLALITKANKSRQYIYIYISFSFGFC